MIIETIGLVSSAVGLLDVLERSYMLVSEAISDFTFWHHLPPIIFGFLAFNCLLTGSLIDSLGTLAN